MGSKIGNKSPHILNYKKKLFNITIFRSLVWSLGSIKLSYFFCYIFLSYRKTFWWVVRKKSTENYSGIPYVATLLNACLWTFYGHLKPGGLLLETVNGIGIVLQLIFVTLFLIYAPKDMKVILIFLFCNLCSHIVEFPCMIHYLHV